MIESLDILVTYKMNVSHGTQCEACSVVYICEVLYFLLKLVNKVPVSASSSFLPWFPS